jgi:alcohol dehydrogenase (cytochrome c)
MAEQNNDQNKRLGCVLVLIGLTATMAHSQDRTLLAKPYVDAVNWTKGIDQKTGKPVDYDPAKDIQVYSNQTSVERAHRLCPSMSGGNNF